MDFSAGFIFGIIFMCITAVIMSLAAASKVKHRCRVCKRPLDDIAIIYHDGFYCSATCAVVHAKVSTIEDLENVIMKCEKVNIDELH